jgi:apolipoprotein N-acyltransferase
VNFALAALSGILLVLCFPKFDFVWLAPFALTPVVIAVAREQRRRWRFALGYVMGLIYWAGINYWIHDVLDQHGGTGPVMAWVSFVLFCLAKAIHIGVFALLAGWAMRRTWAAIAVPAIWVFIEWTNAPFGFAWLDLGNAGVDMDYPMRLAPLTGVYGLSFLFALMATALAMPFLRRPRVQMAPLLLMVVLAVLPDLPAPERGQSAAVLVQPNIPDDQAWNSATFDSTVQQLELLSMVTGSDPTRQPDLLVWPEVPAPLYEKTPEMTRFAQRGGRTYFLAGVVGHNEKGEPLNSAALWSPDGAEVSRYDKVNLVPFGEFVPWPFDFLAHKVSTEAGDFKPGTKIVVSRVNAHRIGTFICYESVFPAFVRKFVLNGAEALFNLSNDSWFGTSGARFQHLKIVRMRAAENARWILRATNDGITVAIDPAGRVTREAPSYQPASLRMGFNYRQNLTFYTRFGDWFVLLCALVGVLAIWSVRAERQSGSESARSPGPPDPTGAGPASPAS